MNWQPIETAPKDGTSILIYEPQEAADSDEDREWHGQYVCHWCGWAWQESSGEGYYTFHPTHWMPLPAPPEAAHPASTSDSLKDNA